MRKVLLTLVVAMAATTGWLMWGQAPKAAAACSIVYGVGGCGYTTNVFGHASRNVLPGRALLDANDAGSLIAIMRADLYSADFQTRLGAAFIINNMIAYGGTTGRPVGGGQTNSINNARFYFDTKWVPLVMSFANPIAPGVGISWNYFPPYPQPFCGNYPSNPSINSAYDPAIGDDIFYYIAAWQCGFEYSASTPEINFYWPGGSFQIGKRCGNLILSLTPLPPLNRLPSGTMTIACDPSTGIQTATVNFSDADGGTNGYITTAGHQSGTVASGAPRVIAMPLSWTNPYVTQGVSLFVQDVGPLGSNTYIVLTPPSPVGTVTPCAQVGCNLTVTPTRIDPYMRFSVTVTVLNNVNQTPPGTVNLQITPPVGAIYNYNGSQALAGGVGPTASVTFANLGPTNNAGVFALRGTVTGPPPLNIVCNGSFSAAYMPYVNVYGGDVMAGSSPSFVGGASNCVSDLNGGAFSWNNHAAGFSGAGAQYAVQTLGAIVDVASALSSSNVPPAGLSFANTFSPADPTKLNPAQGLFGGYFGDGGGTWTGSCDFTSDIKTPPDNSATANAKILALPGSLANNTQTVIYASGDVYISRNIIYNLGGWTDPSQIPSFKLVVTGGNIYIASGVTQLDGLYVSEPTAFGGGRIYTCAKGLGNPWNPTLDYNLGYYAACKTRLVINGAFVARQVWFGRTFGSIGQAAVGDNLPPAPNHDAEVFNYTPELWLPRGNAPPADGYAAITGLPPVL